jgi:hypothetical protein
MMGADRFAVNKAGRCLTRPHEREDSTARPELTAQQRQEGLAKAIQVRRDRAQLLAAAR